MDSDAVLRVAALILVRGTALGHKNEKCTISNWNDRNIATVGRYVFEYLSTLAVDTFSSRRYSRNLAAASGERNDPLFTPS